MVHFGLHLVAQADWHPPLLQPDSQLEQAVVAEGQPVSHVEHSDEHDVLAQPVLQLKSEDAKEKERPVDPQQLYFAAEATGIATKVTVTVAASIRIRLIVCYSVRVGL